MVRDGLVASLVLTFEVYELAKLVTYESGQTSFVIKEDFGNIRE